MKNKTQKKSFIHEKHHPVMKKWLYLFLIFGFGILSYFGVTQPELFQASLTGGSNPSTSADFYIPNDYVAAPGDTVTLEFRAGKDWTSSDFKNTYLKYSEVGILFNVDKINLQKIEKTDSQSPIRQYSYGDIKKDGKIIGKRIAAYYKPQYLYELKKNTVLFEIKFDIPANLPDGTIIDFTYQESTIKGLSLAAIQLNDDSYILKNGQQTLVFDITPGKLTIKKPTSQSTNSNSSTSNTSGVLNTNNLLNSTGSNLPTLKNLGILGGAQQPSAGVDFYIPQDYKASGGSSDYIYLKSGKKLEKIEKVKLKLKAPSTQLTFLEIKNEGNIFPNSVTSVNINKTLGTADIEVNLGSPIDIDANENLMKLFVRLEPNLTSGSVVEVDLEAAQSNIKQSNASDRAPTFSKGVITITSNDLCSINKIDCGSFGQCINGACQCNTGVTGTFCDVCDASKGYSGTPPNCQLSNFGNVSDVILSLNSNSISQLNSTEKTDLYQSVYLLINSSAAAGKTIQVGNLKITIPTPTLSAIAQFKTANRTEEEAKIRAIIENPDGNSATKDGLADLLESMGTNPTQAIARVSVDQETAGLIKLNLANGSSLNSFENLNSTSGDVLVLPAVENKINLPAGKTYNLKLYGKNQDGSLSRLTFNDVKWQPQPVNLLDKNSLDGGILKRGAVGGTTSVFVELQKAGSTTVKSNQITVEVPAEPVIDYLRRIGSGAILRGAQINLSLKILNTVAELKDIRAFIVRSGQTNYEDIKNDPNAVFFSASTIFSQVTSKSAGQNSGTTSGDRIYDVPVFVPQDIKLTPGNYQLVLEVTDMKNNLTGAVLPIRIGNIGTGDLNRDGQLTLLDVITAFQIANGTLTNPSSDQLQAADLNGDGQVSLLDVVQLFNKVNQP